MFDFSPLAGSAGGTPLVILLAVLIFDLVLGFVPQMGQLHPQIPRFRSFFAGLERRLNRERRSEANRIIRGAVVALAALILAVGLGWGLWRLAITLPFGITAEVVVLFLALSQSRVIGAMGKALDGLKIKTRPPLVPSSPPSWGGTIATWMRSASPASPSRKAGGVS